MIKKENKIKINKLFAGFLSVLLCVLLSSCGMLGLGSNSESSGSEAESEVVDEAPAEYPVEAFGYTVRSRPGKVVSLAPSITEKLCDMGFADVLAGVSKSCADIAGIEDIQGIPSCGTALIPDMDEIERISPHLLLTVSELSDDDLILLQQMDVDVVVIPHAKSMKELENTYIGLAKLMEGQYAGGELGGKFVGSLRAKLDRLNKVLDTYTRDFGVKKALYLRMLEFTVATGDTLENELMEFICLENIASEYEDWDYPSDIANGEGRKDFQALTVMYFDEEYVTIKDLEKNTFYKGLTATLKDLFLYIDSEAFERQGLSMFEQLWEMAQYAYPDAGIPEWER